MKICCFVLVSWERARGFDRKDAGRERRSVQQICDDLLGHSPTTHPNDRLQIIFLPKSSTWLDFHLQVDWSVVLSEFWEHTEWKSEIGWRSRFVDFTWRTAHLEDWMNFMARRKMRKFLNRCIHLYDASKRRCCFFYHEVRSSILLRHMRHTSCRNPGSFGTLPYRFGSILSSPPGELEWRGEPEVPSV